jgi:small subunit ribosomal protein S15
MSRMHSDGRGSSGSNKPVTKENPDWVDYDEEEIIDLVVKLRRDGLEPSEIGMKLRDQYGIPSVKAATEKSITEILDEEGMSLEIPEDLKNLVEKSESIREHIDENPADEEAKRRLELTKDKIRKVAQHHRDESNIPQDWEYETPE